jgi:hypothetical protein
MNFGFSVPISDRDILDHGIAEQVLLIPVRQKFACSLEGRQRADEPCADVDCLSTEGSDWLGNEFFKVVCAAVVKP